MRVFFGKASESPREGDPAAEASPGRSDSMQPPLTGVQKAALAAARKGPLFAVGLGWRVKGGRTTFRAPTIVSLAGRGLMRIDADRVELTPAGRTIPLD